MTEIKFSVFPHEGDKEAIEVICPVDDQLAVNLHCHTVNYGEPWQFLDPIFNKFCDRVESLVREYKGIELPRDWIFKDQPELA
jgi:hypothetical protein